jgi:hypothetical protein
MGLEREPDKLALEIAEEILQAIYGDDLKGCTVRPDTVAAIVSRGIQAQAAGAGELIGLYEKVVEAVDLLSTAPDVTKVNDPKELQRLLSERLDAIHVIATKTIDTINRLKKRRQTGSESETLS